MSEETREQTSGADEPYHEESDANPGCVAATGLALLTTLVLTGVVVAGTRSCYSADKNLPYLNSAFEQVPPKRQVEPGVEIQPSRVRERVDAQNDIRLTNYMWLDRDGGIAQIPIGRAMELLLARDLGTERRNEQDRQEEEPSDEASEGRPND